MKLLIDLEKARQGLVLKKVPIKGKNGQVHYGNRWVRPGEEGTPVKTAPQVKLNSSKTVNPDPTATEHKIPFRDMSKEDNGDTDIMQMTKPNTGRLINTIYETPLDDYNSEELDKQIRDVMSWQASIHEGMGEIGAYIRKNMKEDIRKAVTEMIETDDQATDHQKSIQKRTLELSFNSVDGFSSIGSDPRILRKFLRSMLGEETYDTATEYLSKSNLTINGSAEGMASVKKQGKYIASTATRYVMSQSKYPDVAKKQFESLIDLSREHQDMDLLISQLWDTQEQESANPGTWDKGITDSLYELTDRIEAEYRSMGLMLHEDKPTYVAYNPFGNIGGGAPYYGSSVMTVSEDILAGSTLNIGDTFAQIEQIPKIAGMEHLHDLALLKNIMTWWKVSEGKALLNEEPMTGREPGGYYPKWADILTIDEDIPLEIQYHAPYIGKEHIEDIMIF